MRRMRIRTIRRGLSLLELMLALTVTALVAAAISGMMGAVTTGVSSRRDSRTVMVRASAAESRLSAYVAPSRCILDAEVAALVLWLNDDRESDTVHATEIRWLLFDSGSGCLNMYYVSFPAGWTQVAKDLEDKEYLLGTDWMAVLDTFATKGWIAGFTLVDGLESLTIEVDQANPLAASHVAITMNFTTEAGSLESAVAATIRMHLTPAS